MEIHNKNGDEFASMSSKHKKFVEKDFPIALTEFKVAMTKQAMCLDKCINRLEKHSEVIQKAVETYDNNITKFINNLDKKLNMSNKNQDEEREKFVEENDTELRKVHEQQTNLPDDELPDHYDCWIEGHTLSELKKLI